MCFFVVDDRDKVVKMWRDLGLNTFQVAHETFRIKSIVLFFCVSLGVMKRKNMKDLVELLVNKKSDYPSRITRY